MHQILLIAMKDMKRDGLRAYKKLLLVTFASLITIVSISNGLSFLFKEGLFINKANVVVVNEDAHPLSNLLLHQVSEDQNIKNILDILVLQNVEEAEKTVENNNAMAAIIIPKGFINSLEVGRNYPVQLITNSASPVQSKVIESLLNSYMKSVSAGQSAVNAVWDYYGMTDMSYEEKSKKIDSVINDITFRVYLARSNVLNKETILSINNISSMEFYLFSVLVLLTMFIAITGGKEVIYERNNLVFKRLRLGGVSGFKYLLGKYIYLFCKILIQSSFILIITLFILNTNINKEFLLLILLFVLVNCSVISLGLFASLYIGSEDKYVTMGNSFILIMAIIGGSFIPTIYLPDNITILSRYTPNYWALNGFIGIFTNNQKDVHTSLMVLALVTIMFFIASITTLTYKERCGKS
ncbi:ABC transporter permease [Serpentinicella alkaliphila]|uniref:ABC-type multidrug transport system permease subunit n=1 Tax=Serpentinicella alkaliphila TaxID=1734049 RepID=A0A4R2TFP3_9FIRM|nr:ABC transporter permease [Serpentinicella alkaliphila]QUH26991.1 ABC transporter permease [Serpentinicella alkaliphila]TCQ01486.1 ABC-type multidrug transport system permease subunit [Serpentinicella alkaliphila]